MPRQLTSKDYHNIRKLIAHVPEADLPSCVTLAEAQDYHALMLQWEVEMQDREERQAEEEARVNKAIPVEVPSWASIRPGTLVKRSEHYIKEAFHGEKNRAQLGMLVELKQFKDDLCGIATYPVIHWVGEYSSTISHPMNACPADGTQLPTITMNANQRS